MPHSSWRQCRNQILSILENHTSDVTVLMSHQDIHFDDELDDQPRLIQITQNELMSPAFETQQPPSDTTTSKRLTQFCVPSVLLEFHCRNGIASQPIDYIVKQLYCTPQFPCRIFQQL